MSFQDRPSTRVMRKSQKTCHFNGSPVSVASLSHLFLLGILFHSTTNDNLRRPVTYIGPVQKLIIEFILKRERERGIVSYNTHCCAYASRLINPTFAMSKSYYRTFITPIRAMHKNKSAPADTPTTTRVIDCQIRKYRMSRVTTRSIELSNSTERNSTANSIRASFRN